MENTRIANIFEEVADLLELKDANEFRVRSYRNAAQTIRGLSESLEHMVEQDKAIDDLPNIGDATADKIREILDRGTCKRLEDLHDALPEGLTELMQVPGLGPKTAMELYEELEISSVAELEKACKEHRVQELEGLGEKMEEKLLKGIATVRRTSGRILIRDASEQLAELKQHLTDIQEIDRIEIAGSFRRGKETVGDLDILVQAGDREKAGERILDYDDIADVINRGEERISVRLESGLQVDFRFFDESAFGAALLYFTGSKPHNIKLRRRAQDEDWKLNEYGLFSGDRLLAGKTEEAIYKRLQLPWIAPELREDNGEIQAAENHALPKLIEPDEIRGDLQCHTTASDGENSIREMADAARGHGWKFLAITDHSQRVTMANGLDDEAARRHADDIRKVDDDLDDFWLLAGIEVDILKNGELDLKAETLKDMDWVVGSIHYNRNQGKKEMTDRIVAAVETGLLHCLGHPLGRIIGRRDPAEVHLDRIVEACIEHGVRLEINAQPDRLDLPPNHCRGALAAGASFCLGTDAHNAANFDVMRFGVNMARRAWLTKSDVLNTCTIKQLKRKLS